MAKIGRPTLKTDDVCERIFRELAEGYSLRTICAADDMPSAESVRRWLRDDKVFRGQYARAREEQADFYADEIVRIADEETDYRKARVRIDARKWVASKLKPKAYGERVLQELTGPDGESLNFTVNFVPSSNGD